MRINTCIYKVFPQNNQRFVVRLIPNPDPLRPIRNTKRSSMSALQAELSLCLHRLRQSDPSCDFSRGRVLKPLSLVVFIPSPTSRPFRDTLTLRRLLLIVGSCRGNYPQMKTINKTSIDAYVQKRNFMILCSKTVCFTDETSTHRDYWLPIVYS